MHDTWSYLFQFTWTVDKSLICRSDSSWLRISILSAIPFKSIIWQRKKNEMVKGCNDSVRRHWGEINVMGEVSKPLYGPKWPMGPVLNSGFLSMKRLGVLLLPPGWDASPSQGYPQHIFWYPFVHLGEEEHCESKVSCLRTQHNDPG